MLYITAHVKTTMKKIEAVNTFCSYQIDGLILAPVQLGVSLDHLWSLSQSNKPFVSIGKIPGLAVNTVAFDDEKASKIVTDFLIKKGHHNITFLTGPEWTIPNQNRIQGFKQILLENNVPFSENMLVQAGVTSQSGYDVALEILKNSKRRPTALICYNDLVALGAYKAINMLNLHIPDDISIISFDDIPFASLLSPSLTTIAQPSYEMGVIAAELLLNQINSNEKQKPKETILTPELIERDSVKHFIKK